MWSNINNCKALTTPGLCYEYHLWTKNSKTMRCGKAKGKNISKRKFGNLDNEELKKIKWRIMTLKNSNLRCMHPKASMYSWALNAYKDPQVHTCPPWSPALLNKYKFSSKKTNSSYMFYRIWDYIQNFWNV